MVPKLNGTLFSNLAFSSKNSSTKLRKEVASKNHSEENLQTDDHSKLHEKERIN